MRFVRFAVLLFRAVFRKKMGALDESVLKLRVWPNEADISNVHQAVYPLYMELGRWDLALRVGLAKVMWRERCIGFLGGRRASYSIPEATETFSSLHLTEQNYRVGRKVGSF